jgi:hypothetical protein
VSTGKVWQDCLSHNPVYGYIENTLGCYNRLPALAANKNEDCGDEVFGQV